MNTLQEVCDALQNDPKLYAEFKKDPVNALSAAGFTLSPEDLIKISAKVQLDESGNEKLDDRISK